MSGLTDAEIADIKRRFDEGERARPEHDPGECDTCDELRRLDLEELTAGDDDLGWAVPTAGADETAGHPHA